MKYTFFAIISALLLKCSCVANAEEMVDLYTASVATNDSVLWVFQIPRSECTNQPKWNPATQEPPIPIQRLCELAISNVTAPDNIDATKWKVEDIHLQHFPATWSGGEQYPADLVDRWFLVLNLTAYGDYKASDWWNRYRYAVVLLDGTVLKPITKGRQLGQASKATAQQISLLPFFILAVIFGAIVLAIVFFLKTRKLTEQFDG